MCVMGMKLVFAAILSSMVSFLLSFVASVEVRSFTGIDEVAEPGEVSWLGAILVSPFMETLIVAALYYAMAELRLATRSALVVVVIALLISLLHSVSDPIWGVTVFPAFIVFSWLYVIVYPRNGFLHAALTSMLCHALHNSYALLALAFVT